MLQINDVQIKQKTYMLHGNVLSVIVIEKLDTETKRFLTEVTCTGKLVSIKYKDEDNDISSDSVKLTYLGSNKVYIEIKGESDDQ